jgi:hypothetical protein
MPPMTAGNLHLCAMTLTYLVYLVGAHVVKTISVAIISV